MEKMKLTEKYQEIWDECEQEVCVEYLGDLDVDLYEMTWLKFLERVIPEAFKAGQEWEANATRVMPKFVEWEEFCIDHADLAEFLSTVITEE